MRKFVFLISLFLLSLSLVAVGCYAPSGEDDHDEPWDDDDSADDDDAVDDDDAQPDPETDCDDGIDNDEDTLVDCDDEDCADVELCTWPTEFEQRTDVEFEGYEITCGTSPLDFDYQMPDCADRYSSSMTRRTEGDLCPSCDRTFGGDYTPITKGGEDSCSDLLDQPRPRSGSFGIVFTSATEWTVWAQDGNTGEWSESGVATDNGSGTFVFAASDVVNEAIDDVIDCPEQDLGLLSVTLQFTPPAAG